MISQHLPQSNTNPYPEALSAALTSRRVWLIPALLLLILLAPLSRVGLPATHMGALSLQSHVATQVVAYPWLFEWLGVAWGYKVALMIWTVVGAVLMGWLAGLFWRREVAWWVVSLWVMLPLTVSLVYQLGAVFYLVGVSGWLLALGLMAFAWQRLNNPTGFGYLLGLGALLVGGVAVYVLWNHQIALDPYQLFSPAWPEAASQRDWVGSQSFQLGLVPTVLAFLTAMVAWERREERVARRVLFLVAVAALCGIFTFWDGPQLLYLVIATTCLLLAAGGLPILDERYASLPVLVGIVAIAALTIYPNLQVAWLPAESLPAAPMGALFGENQFWLLEANSYQEGEMMVLEVLWQVTAPTRRDYTAFVHLLESQGDIISQADALLLDQDEVSTSRWPVGYLVRQRYEAVSATAPNQIRLGLYDLETLQRLPLHDGGDSLTFPVP